MIRVALLTILLTQTAFADDRPLSRAARWRAWACALALSAIPIFGCHRAGPPTVAPPPTLPPNEFAVEILKSDSAADLSSRSAMYVFPTSSGKVAVIESIDTIGDDDGKRAVRLALLGPDRRVDHTKALGFFDARSNFLETGPARFEFAVGRSSLDDRGTIQNNFRLLRIDVGSGAEARDLKTEVLESGRFALATQAYRAGKLATPAETDAMRIAKKDRRDAYRDYLLAPGSAKLTLLGTPGRELFWGLPSESGLYGIGGRRFLPARPWVQGTEDAEETPHWVALRSAGAVPQPTLATVGGARGIAVLLGALGLEAPRGKADTSYLTLVRFRDGKPELVDTPRATETFDLDLTAGFQTAEATYFLANANIPPTSTEVWLGRLDADGLKEYRFQLGPNAIAHGLTFDKASGEIFVFGRSDFGQARSGSVGAAKGFVLHLGRDAKEIARYRFTGSSTTAVETVAIARADGKRRLWIAGTTNGSTTHDQRISQSFIQSLELKP